MSDSDGKVLTGLARSIDDLFLNAGHPPRGSGPAAAPSVEDGAALDDAPVLGDAPAFGEAPALEDSPTFDDPGAATLDDAGALGLGAFDVEPLESEASALDFAEPDAPADDGPDTVEMEAFTLDGFDTHVGGSDAPAPIEPAPAAAEDEEGFVPTPLDLAVDAFLAGETDRADEIDTLGRECMASHDVEPVARSIERLTLAAGEPRDDATYAVAESLMYPLALDRVVRHMGLERNEEKRRDFYTICRAIGAPITPAIRNELGETNTDRLARRIYCEALTEMGQPGRDMIEEMVESDNQFLVRNAVSILGDHGGERAVEMVTSALGNPDRRVRREALKALAKLGDESSGEVVIGFLEDPDEKVRLAAAVACGELKVARALRPLVAMLDQTKDPDQAILIIRALGHLGDPGAVLSLEKHAVRTMFSRPRTDVRIAAYRALHQIGTPKTRQMLLEVAKDKDEDVKDAVKKMLYG